MPGDNFIFEVTFIPFTKNQDEPGNLTQEEDSHTLFFVCRKLSILSTPLAFLWSRHLVWTDALGTKLLVAHECRFPSQTQEFTQRVLLSSRPEVAYRKGITELRRIDMLLTHPYSFSESVKQQGQRIDREWLIALGEEEVSPSRCLDSSFIEGWKQLTYRRNAR